MCFTKPLAKPFFKWWSGNKNLFCMSITIRKTLILRIVSPKKARKVEVFIN